MLKRGSGVDRFSFPLVLKAAGKVKAVDEGMMVHGLVVKMGFADDSFVETGLVGMYAFCGEFECARKVFDRMTERDIVTWNIMIDGYCKSGLFDEVVLLLEEMKRCNIEADVKLFSTILSACGRAGNLEFGKAIHKIIVDDNVMIDYRTQSTLVTMYACCGSMDLAQDMFDKLNPKNVVASTAMVSGYSKQGQVDLARAIFGQMAKKDLICWSAMISGYAESDAPQEAIKLFGEMQDSGIYPDHVTMLSVISAGANVGALDQARWIDEFVKRNRFGDVLPINNALIDMYAKCGSLEDAREVFVHMRRKNVITWTTMISALAMHGDAINALKIFHQMKSENVEPNGVTFVGVLYACSHAGLVEEGIKLFASMVDEYGITPKHEHYGCMVDLMVRANLLREALQLIESMPFAPNVVIWGSLMSACKVHGEFELGEFAAKQLLKLDPDHDGAHVLLSNIYAKEKQWHSVGEVRQLMKHKGISKERGTSRIELNNEVHEFLTADKYHKQSDEIYTKLNEVVTDVKRIGYTPITSNVLTNLDEEEKKEAVLWHSEKLALSYGLLSRETGTCIHIIKNLRICEDCHTFMKLVSDVYKTEIVVRDRTRFHHYKNGVCSCNDYW
ncbi:LOW QUALITY PROTEIN: pentatricopeptide repeat-containing protein At4g14820-like [Apium graveolens]|uniref:LOW QUALITY PROTEIN: pentatricopeptide repeat-containing protein At4g14820-like n=1 Tax=Apium graveolens TaxID=4045 RepID=UPI003D7A3FFD